MNGWSAGITHNTGFSFFLIALCVGSSSTTSLPCNAYNKLHLTLFPISKKKIQNTVKNLHVRTQWFKNLLAEMFSLIPKNNCKNLFSQANSAAGSNLICGFQLNFLEDFKKCKFLHAGFNCITAVSVTKLHWRGLETFSWHLTREDKIWQGHA